MVIFVGMFFIFLIDLILVCTYTTHRIPKSVSRAHIVHIVNTNRGMKVKFSTMQSGTRGNSLDLIFLKRPYIQYEVWIRQRSVVSDLFFSKESRYFVY